MIKKEITDENLKKHLSTLEDDKMHLFTMADGRVRGALFHGTHFVNQLRIQHNLGILETYILGQASLCAALTIPMMKDLEHLSIKYEASNLVNGYSVEADSTGYVRGYLFNDKISIEKPLENWNLKPFLGQGTLTFSRIHKDDKFPQSSSVEVSGENIAQDFTSYFFQSEQINTAFNSSIQFDKEGRVIGAGAMFLQVMPKTGGNAKYGSQIDSRQEEEDDDLIKVENAFKACPSLGLLYSENHVDSDDIILGLFREFKPTITLRRDVKYDCPCSEEKFLNYIRSFSKEQILDLKENGPNPLSITCKNCGCVFQIPVSKI